MTQVTAVHSGVCLSVKPRQRVTRGTSDAKRNQTEHEKKTKNDASKHTHSHKISTHELTKTKTRKTHTIKHKHT